MDPSPYESPKAALIKRLRLPLLIVLASVSYMLGRFLAPADPVSVYLLTAVLFAFALGAFGAGWLIGKANAVSSPQPPNEPADQTSQSD